MISKKVFYAIGNNTRFISNFIIASEQNARVYAYIHDEALNPNGTEDVLQNGSTDRADWVWPTNIWKRGTDAPDSGEDLLTIEKWDLVTNSILMYTAPIAPTKIWLEVATNPEEFGSTLIQPSVAQADAAAAAALVSENNAKASEDAVAADLLLTNADAVATAADRVQTGLDRVATNADVVITNADAVTTAADRVQTGLDRVQTGIDVGNTVAYAQTAATNKDISITQAGLASASADSAETDRIQTGLDEVATNADAIATAADRVQTGLDEVATNADAVATAADRVQTGLDRVQTGADRVKTTADEIATNADAIATASDKVATNADVVLTGDDVVSAQAILDATLLAGVVQPIFPGDEGLALVARATGNDWEKILGLPLETGHKGKTVTNKGVEGDSYWSPFVSSPNTVSADFTIETGTSASIVSPTIEDGVTVTIPDGSVLVIL